MIDKIFPPLIYVIRWLAWCFHYIIVLPAGVLVLMGIALFWQSNSTPGKAMVDVIASATRNVNAGEFRISGCEVVNSPQSRESCGRNITTDAAGYAAYIDHSWRDLLIQLWIVIALSCCGLAWLYETYPVYPRAFHLIRHFRPSKGKAAEFMDSTGLNEKGK